MSGTSQHEIIVDNANNILFEVLSDGTINFNGLSLKDTTLPKIGIGTSDPSGTFHINETNGTLAAANTGSLVLSHDDGGGGNSIVFLSRNNYNNDYAFIEYNESIDSTSGENGRLRIGCMNDIADSINFYIGGTDKMIIDNSGLKIDNNYGGGIIKGVDGNHAIYLRRGYDESLDVLDFHEFGKIRFFTGNAIASQTEKMCITTNGKVGIGTSDPSGTFHINETNGTLAAANTGSLVLSHDDGGGGNSIVFLSRNNYNNDYAFIEYNESINSTSGETGRLRIGCTNDTTDSINFFTGASDRMSIINIGVGIGTISPESKLHIGNVPLNDNTRTYDSNSLIIVHPTVTSTTTLNDPEELLYLIREGTVGQAFAAAATFKLCRYENSSTGSRTRMDIDLTHDSFNDVNVMTMRSDGRVGIKKTNPGYDLDVNGNINFSGNITKNGSAISLWTKDQNNERIYYAPSSAGRVGINDSTPSYALDVTGDINFTGDVRQNGSIINLTPTWTTTSSSPTTRIYRYVTSGTDAKKNNVGIGLNSPNGLLHLHQAGASNLPVKLTDSNFENPHLLLTSVNSNRYSSIFFSSTTDSTDFAAISYHDHTSSSNISSLTFQIEDDAEDKFVFRQDANDVMTIRNHRVGVGIDYPRGKLHVHHQGEAATPIGTNNASSLDKHHILLTNETAGRYTTIYFQSALQAQGSGAGDFAAISYLDRTGSTGESCKLIFSLGNDTNDFYTFRFNGTDKVTINSNGTITAGGTVLTSDDRFKHNEIEITNAVDIIKQLVPKKYFKTTDLYDASNNFNLDQSGNPIDSSGNNINCNLEVGLIAQEVQKIDDISFVVKEIPDDFKTLSVDYNSLNVLSIAAIKELELKIRQLEDEINQLKSKIN